MQKILIKDGILINPGGKSGKYDILIDNGKVVDIKKDIIPDDKTKVINAHSKYVSPGFIDMHTHLRDPGDTRSEDVESLSNAALSGGYTTVCVMANTKPVIDNARIVGYLQHKIEKSAKIRIFPYGAITKGLEGKEIAPFYSLYKAGVVGFSDDGRGVQNANVMRNALIYNKVTGLPFILHEEDENLSGDGVMNEGSVSIELGFRAIPASSEETMIARDIVLSKETGVPIHITHISTKGAVELVRKAKKDGVKITADCTPHHFSLTDIEVKKLGRFAKVKPPLRSREDVDAIIEGLKDGTIDAIATDHAPHYDDYGTLEMTLAPFGFIGLETSFGLGVKVLVEEGHLTLEELISKVTINPARILNLPYGVVEKGKAADIVIFDPDRKWKVEKEIFHSRSVNSPFIGWTLKGKIEKVLIDGEIRYSS